MVKQGAQWIGRDAADIVLRAENDTWKVYDGNGLTHTFTQDPQLFGSNLWLLRSIAGPGNNEVQLTYAIGTVALSGTSTPGLTNGRYGVKPRRVSATRRMTSTFRSSRSTASIG
jgi:hypothetical protein